MPTSVKNTKGGIMIRDELGLILVNQGSLTQDQLVQCESEMEQKNISLLQCLKDKNLVSSSDIARAFAKLVNAPYMEKISEKAADPALLGRIPLKFLRQHEVIPVIVDDAITLVTANPRKFEPLDELRMLLGADVGLAISTSEVIVDAINRYYPLEGAKQMIEELEEAPEGAAVDFGEIEEKDILAMAAEAPIIKLVNHVLVQAVKRGASDIHIEPYEKEMRVRYRIDGVMYEAMTPPKRVQAALVSRIKIMANLNIAEKRKPQDGRIEIKVADKAYDIRVSVLPTSYGERIVMRLLDKSRTFVKITDLGFGDRDYAVIQAAISRPNGIVYVTGPTGSGKTSTLYSILSELNTPEVNIITVEDPVEYQMKGIGQVQVRADIGLTFAAALRSILRQDPDIVMIGETRDQETAQIAVQAALTGHLVLSTLHTNDAPSSITRLIDMGVEPFLIASSVVAIIAQRLVRKLCNHCKQVYTPSEQTLKSLGLTPQQAQEITFYKAVGCEECGNTGYRGRLAIFEVMSMTPEIAKLTMDRSDAMVLRRQALADGMTLLVQDGVRKIKLGITTPEEVVRVATAGEETAVT
jgi:general secretion pathway protein E